MLVGPGRVETRTVSYPEDRVGAHEIPRVHRLATVEGIANELRRVDGVDAAIAVGRADPVDAVDELLILVDAFFVFGSGAVRHPRNARAACNSVTGRDRRRSEHAIVGDIVVGTGGPRR